MIIGEVIDQFYSSHKDPCFEGQKLLLVQPLTLDGKAISREILEEIARLVQHAHQPEGRAR